MTYREVEERFTARFESRSGRGGLFRLDWFFPSEVGNVGVVWADVIEDPDAAIAPTLATLLAVAPRAAEFPTPAVIIGEGPPIAWLWERIGEQVIEVRERCTDDRMAGAVAVALGWVW